MEEDLREAVCIGNEDRVIKYIKSGVDIDSQNSVNGWSALHWAAKRGYVHMVKLLLDAGAKTKVLNNDGKSPLQLSSKKEIRTLLGAEEGGEATSEVSDPGHIGFTPNYLKYPQFPYISDSKSSDRGADCGNEANLDSNDADQMLSNYLKCHQFSGNWDSNSSASGEKGHATFERDSTILNQGANFATGGFIFQPQTAFCVNRTEYSPCGWPVNPRYLVLKVRCLAHPNFSDFIEISFDRKETLTLEQFKLILLGEFDLEGKGGRIKLIRKLPDTLIRNEEDVCRLTDYQQLEISLNPVSDL